MNLNELKHKAAVVSDTAFGKDNPITGPLHHLHEEIDEVLECIATGTDPNEEFADCLLLLIDAYRKHYGDDVDMQKLIDVSSDKLDVVAKRKWGLPDAFGVFKRIPDETPKPIETWGNMDIDAITKAYEDIKPIVLYEMCVKDTRDKIKLLLEMVLPNYTIKCDEENNSPDVIDSGHIIARVRDEKHFLYVDVIF